MTMARDVIAGTMMQQMFAPHELPLPGNLHVRYFQIADAAIAALLSAPEPVRLELAALLNPWRPIEGVPPELKDGRPVLALIPCYGHYNEIGKLRGYLHAIVTWKYGQWNEVGVGKREPAYFQEFLPAPPSEVRGGPVEGIDPQVRRSPLPKEIAGLIKRANDGAINTEHAEDRKLFVELGDALRGLARENERRKENEMALGAAVLRRQDRITELEAERDAIRAKTFGDCARVAAGFHDGTKTAGLIVHAIRALAQTDETTMVGL